MVECKHIANEVIETKEKHKEEANMKKNKVYK